MLTIIITALIIGLASLVFATFGFGDALVAMPFLTLLLGVKIAAPLMTLNGITLSFIILVRSWRHIVWRDAAHLLIAALPGVALGIYGLKHSNETIMQAVLGCVIIGVATFNLLRPQQMHLQNRLWAYPFGLAGGILGGAYNISGPAVVIYGTLRGWTSARFVSTLQGFFLPINIATLLGHYYAKTLNVQVGQYYLYCLPGLLLALIVGTYWRKHFDAAQYRQYIFGMLLLSGSMLLIKALI